MRVRDRQGVFVDGLDGPPDVDDLEALLAELISFFG